MSATPPGPGPDTGAAPSSGTSSTRGASASPRQRWRRWRHSLGARLVLLFALLALASSAIFIGGVQHAFGVSWRAVVRPLVEDYVNRLAAEVGSPPDVARAQALTQRLPLALRISGPVVNWDSTAPTAASASSPAGALGDAPPRPAREAPGFRPPPGLKPDHAWLARTTADGHHLQFALDTEGWVQRPRAIGALTLAALLGLLFITWAVVRHGLIRPLRQIGAGAERFAQGEFGTPIALAQRDELGELAGRVNHMASALNAMLEGQRQLLLAISHELRSPLTRARLHAELLAQGPEQTALLRDLGLMRDLIADLLESQRLATPHAALQREPTDGAALAALIAQVRAELHPAFPQAEPLLRVDEPERLAALPSGEVDRPRLALLLRNLLANAWRHAADAPAPPELHLAWEPGAAAPRPGASGAQTEPAGWLVLTVRDHGPGVAPEHLAHLAEPFYRPDSARTRSAGGVGLGLHLCRRVAEAHGGGLAFELAQPGLNVRLRLPWGARTMPAP